MMKKVMINVDDLGLSPAVNEAVVALAEMGRIQATSLMSLGLVAANEISALKQLNIDIGLHFDLTAFANEGDLKTILLRSYLRRWPQKHLQQLICTQLDEFENKVQAVPVFVDGHQHVHQFPQVRQALLAEISRRYGNKVAIRNTFPVQKDLKAKIIYHLGGRQLRHMLIKQHWLHNSAFAGFYHFQANFALLQTLWTDWLAKSVDHTIIMCHPAIPASDWQDAIKPAREQEWHWLGSPEFIDCWQQANCTAWSWTQNK